MTGVSGMSSNAKMWAWSAGILGIVLVVCGFLSQTPQKDSCKASHYTWASVIIGFIMLLAGFMTLMKMSRKPLAQPGPSAAPGAAPTAPPAGPDPDGIDM